MILSAGLGTRLKPWTDHHPKALAVVNGKSLLQRNVEYLQGFGIREVVVNVHHFAHQIIEAVNQNNGWGSNINISNETDEVLETGGGLLKAAPFLRGNAPFVLMNVDILTDLDLGLMMKDHFEHKPLATLATSSRQTSRYLLFDEQNKLCGWRNVNTGEERPGKPAPPDPLKGELPTQPPDPLKGEPPTHTIPKAFSGIHVIDPVIFSLVQRQGKFSMIDVYLDLMQERTIRSFDHSGVKFIDVGKPESIAAAELLF